MAEGAAQPLQTLVGFYAEGHTGNEVIQDISEAAVHQPQSHYVHQAPPKAPPPDSSTVSAAAPSSSPLGNAGNPQHPSSTAQQSHPANVVDKHTDATPSAMPPADAHAGPSLQATCSDHSRPSFLSMLQSKMDKRREQRRESQSAGSASDSSFSSVHAAGTTSAEKPGTSADSGACLVLLT